MQEDYEDEDYNDEDIEGEEDLILEPAPDKKDALLNLIDHQIYFIQQLEYIDSNVFDIEKAKCAASCFKVIDAAQMRLLEKIKEM